MLRAAMRAFLVGEIDKIILDEFRGRCLMCSELAALEWPHVLFWYFGDVPQEQEKHV